MSGRTAGVARTKRQVERWAEELGDVGQRIGSRFSRSEPRQRVVGYLQGLLGGAERKNGWQLAEDLGESTPDGVQHLLSRARWDTDAVRDDLVQYVANHLGDADGVLIVDETGFLKKGRKSVGVARQYSGTAGRIENCQIGVFLGYSTRHGQALLDRRLYLPKPWVEDSERRSAAGVPKPVRFATKIVLARRMIATALEAGVPARWITADAVYGSDYPFRKEIEDRGLGYVVGVRTDQAVWTGIRQVRVRSLLATIPDDGWQRLSCGNGSKGPRLYDWVLIPINAPEPETYRRWLLIRRNITDPKEVAYFLCGGEPTTTLPDLVRVAGQRWTIEECFELAKGDCGLDEYEVRSWTGWHRHVTLSLFALAVLAVIRSRIRSRARTSRRARTPTRTPTGRKKGGLTEPKV